MSVDKTQLANMAATIATGLVAGGIEVIADEPTAFAEDLGLAVAHNAVTLAQRILDEVDRRHPNPDLGR